MVESVEGDEEQSHVETIMRQLEKLFEEALEATFPDGAPVVTTCRNPNFGHYQCNNAQSVWSKIKGKGTQFSSPEDVGKAIVNSLPPTEMIESCNVAKSGFVNIVLSNKWMAKNIIKMLTDGVEIWAPRLGLKRVVVDFSSPNIAKEMHVGHLRSTIIGDTIARMLEFSNVEVLRRNHVGDWGTQFGMLIEYLFENADADAAGEQDIGDLQAFYRKSKERFDSDPEFKERAQKAVVSLQGGVERYLKAWKKICEISREGFEEVYQRLGVKLEEKGESFYNPYIPAVVKELDTKGLIKEDEGARVIFIEGKEVPFIVVKRDGGFNYASTDLTAMWYRLHEEKAEWVIYVTDVGQTEHFENLFTSAKRAGWLPAGDNVFPKATHVGFGLVLGEDGKRFRTRSTEVVRLVDLLDEAKNRCKKTLESRGKNTDDRTAEAIGYGAVKYADLKNKRLTNYTFDFDQMLNDKGDTAVYLLYAYARICSIINKSGENVQELKKTGNIALGEPVEHALALRLLQFAEAVEEACTSLFPHKLCEYLYKLSEDFNKFYTKCHVNSSTVPQSTQHSRLLLCEATAVVMRKCFYLLGITPVDKI